MFPSKVGCNHHHKNVYIYKFAAKPNKEFSERVVWSKKIERIERVRLRLSSALPQIPSLMLQRVYNLLLQLGICEARGSKWFGRDRCFSAKQFLNGFDRIKQAVRLRWKRNEIMTQIELASPFILCVDDHHRGCNFIRMLEGYA